MAEAPPPKAVTPPPVLKKETKRKYEPGACAFALIVVP
jgi:hypothetical protein